MTVLRMFVNTVHVLECKMRNVNGQLYFGFEAWTSFIEQGAVGAK